MAFEKSQHRLSGRSGNYMYLVLLPLSIMGNHTCLTRMNSTFMRLYIDLVPSVL
jgi:hypothetical protein